MSDTVEKYRRGLGEYVPAGEHRTVVKVTTPDPVQHVVRRSVVVVVFVKQCDERVRTDEQRP